MLANSPPSQVKSDFDQLVFIIDKRDGVFRTIPVVSKKTSKSNKFSRLIDKVKNIGR
jgi:hypothetical protein